MNDLKNFRLNESTTCKIYANGKGGLKVDVRHQFTDKKVEGLPQFGTETFEVDSKDYQYAKQQAKKKAGLT